MFGGQFDRLTAIQNGCNDVRGKECRGHNPADLAIVQPEFVGEIGHRDTLDQTIPPPVRLCDGFDEFWVDGRHLPFPSEVSAEPLGFGPAVVRMVLPSFGPQAIRIVCVSSGTTS